MEMTDSIYDFYYDTGERKFEATGDNSGVMTTYGAETFSQTDCMTVIGPSFLFNTKYLTSETSRPILGPCGSRRSSARPSP